VAQGGRDKTVVYAWEFNEKNSDFPITKSVRKRHAPPICGALGERKEEKRRGATKNRRQPALLSLPLWWGAFWVTDNRKKKKRGKSFPVFTAWQTTMEDAKGGSLKNEMWISTNPSW